jgi:hypothetical protein
MPNSCLPHTWNDPTSVPCSGCGKDIGPGERTAVWGGFLCDACIEVHRAEAAERSKRFESGEAMVISPELANAVMMSGRGLFNSAADIAGQYHEAQKKMADAGDPIAKLIVEQLEAIRAGKSGPLSGR